MQELRRWYEGRKFKKKLQQKLLDFTSHTSTYLINFIQTGEGSTSNLIFLAVINSSFLPQADILVAFDHPSRIVKMLKSALIALYLVQVALGQTITLRKTIITAEY